MRLKFLSIYVLGDIFKARSVHPSYGQPPLSFYILCINQIKPKSINMIFEDYSNPVIRPLIKYINSINCNLELNNSRLLKEDVSSVLSAKNIIFKGTFIPGILLGCKTIIFLYTFELSENFKS